MAPTKLVRLLPIIQRRKLGKLTGALGLFKNINIYMSKQYFGFEQVASAAEGSFFGKKTGGFQASRTVCKLENPQNRRLI